MKFGPYDDKLWFFVWVKGRPYVTSIAAHRRADAIREAETLMGEKWPKIYRQGGRVMRCRVVPCNSGSGGK